MGKENRLTIFKSGYGICYFSKYHFDKEHEQYIVPADRMEKGEIDEVLGALYAYEETGFTVHELLEMKKKKEKMNNG